MRIVYVNKALNDLEITRNQLIQSNNSKAFKDLCNHIIDGFINYLESECVNVDVETGEILNE